MKRPRASRARSPALWLALACALSATLGCTRGHRSADRRELVVFAAASLRDAFGALRTRFERDNPGVHVVFHFAGTQACRTQLELGAAADVFAAAAEDDMQALVDAGLVGAPTVFARNELVLVVSHEARVRLRTLADLPSATRLVIGAPEVPIGRYTLEVLAQAERAEGAGFAERVLGRVVSRELNVRQVLNKVVLGEAEAGFVYRSDALVASSGVAVVSLPADVAVDARYPVAPLLRASQPDLARAFVQLLLSPDGQAALATAGFSAVSAGGRRP